jgi:hypothetical protein
MRTERWSSWERTFVAILKHFDKPSVCGVARTAIGIREVAFDHMLMQLEQTYNNMLWERFHHKRNKPHVQREYGERLC